MSAAAFLDNSSFLAPIRGSCARGCTCRLGSLAPPLNPSPAQPSPPVCRDAPPGRRSCCGAGHLRSGGAPRPRQPGVQVCGGVGGGVGVGGPAAPAPAIVMHVGAALGWPRVCMGRSGEEARLVCLPWRFLLPAPTNDRCAPTCRLEVPATPGEAQLEFMVGEAGSFICQVKVGAAPAPAAG